ncbi:MAG TPA: carbamoyltransferase C-terminal domain-containing protein [Gemmatimonadaceae bacterium]|jgi:carbamoyltransferase|nr:carbamoyltransferase C-terminal domain-containing protein [Gemmatimonadaceae bacterium]
MYVLGINAYHADVSAALLRDGVLVAAVEEERFRRIKHYAGFPTMAIRSVLAEAGIRGADVDHVAISRSPRAHIARKALFALTHWPNLDLIRDRLRNRRKVTDVRVPLADALDAVPPKLHFVEHHPAHLASAFFVSPFEDAACCAVDGFGDFVSTSMAIGRGNRFDVLRHVFFPHSLGMMYTAVTQYLGFPSFGDEFKVMGLAPYGKPTAVAEIRKLVRLTDGGRFELDLRYFRHWSDGVAMEWDNGYPTLGSVFTSDVESLLGPSRKSDEPLTPRHEDVAHSLQVVYEECFTHVLEGLWDLTHTPRLCLAGGCAMNSVANGKIRQRTPFREVYIQPASSDNGTALGAAYYVWNQVLGRERAFVMDHGYWGPAHDEASVLAKLDGACTIERFATPDAVAQATARLIADGNVVGWYQGRMEWGARALGNRSIVADPRRADIRELINVKIKFREKFRPFAPSVAEEAIDEWFEGAVPDPFMIQVYPVRPDKRALIPAVTHVDGSGRLQTVSARTNPAYYRLIKAFEALTGVPIVLNTSFNENEPIVETPAQALDCFLRTKMDAIVLNTTLVRRK